MRQQQVQARSTCEPTLVRTIEAAKRALATSPVGLYEATDIVPPRPGLYAIYAAAAIWGQLGLGKPPDDRPLYVGKAEESLVGRDLRTHFADGRTGQSTVRRSFAALLADTLDLAAQPRNASKPERFASYGLSKEGDAKLTAWMRHRLQIAVWAPSPPVADLGIVEQRVFGAWEPPLNLRDVSTPWTGFVKAKRAVLARQAETWQPD
jgi:GIY-YIG catalytic domain